MIPKTAFGRSFFRIWAIGLSEVICLGYRIEYDGREGKYEIRRYYPYRLPALFLAAASLFLVLTFAFWEAGADYIREALIPGENAVTVAAFENLTKRLRQGENLGDAVTEFCMDVIHGSAPAN